LAQVYNDAGREIGTLEFTGGQWGDINDYSLSFSNRWFETYKKAMDAYAGSESWKGVWD